MVCTMRTFRGNRHHLWRVAAACIVLMSVALAAPGVRAGDAAEIPTRVIVTTKTLPANFQDTLRDVGLELMNQETLGALGLVMIELRVNGDDTRQHVFERLQSAFPGHPFEWLEDDELDYELSAL